MRSVGKKRQGSCNQSADRLDNHEDGNDCERRQ
jgi:hypothetical protein